MARAAALLLAMGATIRAGAEDSRRGSTPALRRHLGEFCEVYEVCQCRGGANESSTECIPGTCRYSKRFPIWSVCYHQAAKCDDWAWRRTPARMEGWPTWEDCQWANFGEAGKYPGDNDILTAIPKKAFNSSTLAGVSKVTLFTDRDDTLVCSGAFPAACAGTSPGLLFPGAPEFELALTEGPSGTLPKQLVIPLTERPYGATASPRITEDCAVSKAFMEVGGGDWGFVLNGTMYTRLQDSAQLPESAAALTPFRTVAYTKYRGWKDVVTSTVWYGGDSIFIGDNGEGDLVAAQMMVKSGRLLAAFIHDVKQACQDAACRTEWATYGIFMFDNYVDAANTAVAKGLISKAGCLRVCNAKGAEFVPCAC